MKRWSAGHLKAGWGSVRTAKLRSFWTMLGVIIGVASVISVVAIGEGIKQQIGGQLHHAGTNLIVIRPTQLETGAGSSGHNVGVLSGLSLNGPLSSKDVMTVTHVSGLAASAPLTIVGGPVHGDSGAYTAGYVIGTTPDLPSLLNQSLSTGQFISDDDAGQNVAVLGQGAAEKLFDVDVPLGRSFDFHGQSFIVEGIFNEFNNSSLSQQANFNNAIFIPNDVAESLTNNTAPTYEVLARPSSPAQINQTVRHLQTALDKAHGGYSGFSVLTGRQSGAQDNSILDLLTRLIAGVAAISLLVGGIGIMNVMLVSVAERMHEIGIRKAVGATNRQILSQFMVESTLLSLTGGVLGIALAGLVDVGLRVTTSLEPRIGWLIVVIATGVSLLVGIVFGTVPAVKAARKDPIEALRSE